jgi:hypothetical protein
MQNGPGNCFGKRAASEPSRSCSAHCLPL